MPPWNFGPVERRMYDEKNKWPKVINIFKGKDDENYMEKTSLISRYTIIGTGLFSMWDITLLPHKPAGIATALSRIKYWAVPIVGGGIVYTSTVNLISGLRGGKTDQKNHAAAGYAVGALIGKHSKSTLTGFVVGSFLALLAAFIKDSDMYHYNMFPVLPNKQTGGPLYHKHDYTMLEDRAGYWVRTEEEIPAMWKRGQI